MKLLYWIMDPIFSQEFVAKFVFLGDLGILLLALLKMVIMFGGTLLLMSPFLPFLIKIYRRLWADFIDEEEQKQVQPLIPSKTKKLLINKGQD